MTSLPTPTSASSQSFPRSVLPGTSTTSTRKKLFVGAIFSVYASPQERAAIEQFVMNEAGGAITALHDAAQYILVPMSENIHHAVEELGPKLGQKAIRLELKYNDHTSNRPNSQPWSLTSYYTSSLPPSLERQASDDTSFLNESPSTHLALSVVPPQHHPSQYPQSHFSSDRKPQQSSDSPLHAKAASSVEESAHTVRKPSTSGSSDVSTSHWNERMAMLRPLKKISTHTDHQHPDLDHTPNPHSTPTSEPWAGGFAAHYKQLWAGQTFWVVGPPGAVAKISEKITSRGGTVMDRLTSASRVIFTGPIASFFVRQTLIDYDRVRAANFRYGPCLPIAEGWIHDCHAAGEMKSWTPYKITEAGMLTDHEFWKSIGAGYGSHDRQAPEVKETSARFWHHMLSLKNAQSGVPAQLTVVDEMDTGQSAALKTRPEQPKAPDVPPVPPITPQPKGQAPRARKSSLIEEWRAARRPTSLKTNVPDSQASSKGVVTRVQPSVQADLRYPTPTSPATSNPSSKVKNWTALASAFTKSQAKATHPPTDHSTDDKASSAIDPQPDPPPPVDDFDDLAGLFSSDEEDVSEDKGAEASIDHRAQGEGKIDPNPDSSDNESPAEDYEDNDDWEVLRVILGSSKVVPGAPTDGNVKQELINSRCSTPLSSIDEDEKPRPPSNGRQLRRKAPSYPKIAAAQQLGESFSEDDDVDELGSGIQQACSKKRKQTRQLVSDVSPLEKKKKGGKNKRNFQEVLPEDEENFENLCTYLQAKVDSGGISGGLYRHLRVIRKVGFGTGFGMGHVDS
ncbi:hypothetical protein IAU59_002093 [Kwoniella sp. CBS 9459]